MSERINPPINPDRPLGEGYEKRVFEHKANPDLAVGVYHEDMKESPETTKGRYYIQKIAHLLMPDNIPDIHLAATDPHMVVTDKLDVDDMRTAALHEYTVGEAKIADAFDRLQDFGIVIDDGHRENFVYDNDLRLKYSDVLAPWISDKDTDFLLEPMWDSEQLRASIESLTGKAREKGMKYLERLEALKKQEVRHLVEGNEMGFSVKGEVDPRVAEQLKEAFIEQYWALKQEWSFSSQKPIQVIIESDDVYRSRGADSPTSWRYNFIVRGTRSNLVTCNADILKGIPDDADRQIKHETAHIVIAQMIGADTYLDSSYFLEEGLAGFDGSDERLVKLLQSGILSELPDPTQFKGMEDVQKLGGDTNKEPFTQQPGYLAMFSLASRVKERIGAAGVVKLYRALESSGGLEGAYKKVTGEELSTLVNDWKQEIKAISEKESAPSQVEAGPKVKELAEKVRITKPEDLIEVRDLIYATLEARPYTDETKEAEHKIRWRRTAEEILSDGYVYQGKACTDRNVVFLAICKELGIEGRFVKMKGEKSVHSISEVKIGDKWYHFDPSYPKSFPVEGEIEPDRVYDGRTLWAKGRDSWDLGLVKFDSIKKIK